MLESREFFSYSADKATDDCIDILEEVLNTFDVPGLLPCVLHLKEKIPVMLMRNLIRKKKLYNGKIPIVNKVTGSFLYTMNPETNEELIFSRLNLESDI